jgi:hypothetical protein
MTKERGEGRVGLIIALLILSASIYVGIKVIPLKIALFTLNDKIEQKLQRASWRSYDQAKGDTLSYVREQAAATGYPIDHLKVSMPTPVGNQMRVVVDWQIPIDFAVTQYVWNYHLEKQAPMLGRGGSGW